MARQWTSLPVAARRLAAPQPPGHPPASQSPKAALPPTRVGQAQTCGRCASIAKETAAAASTRARTWQRRSRVFLRRLQSSLRQTHWQQRLRALQGSKTRCPPDCPTWPVGAQGGLFQEEQISRRSTRASPETRAPAEGACAPESGSGTTRMQQQIESTLLQAQVLTQWQVAWWLMTLSLPEEVKRPLLPLWKRRKTLAL